MVRPKLLFGSSARGCTLNSQLKVLMSRRWYPKQRGPRSGSAQAGMSTCYRLSWKPPSWWMLRFLASIDASLSQFRLSRVWNSGEHLRRLVRA